VGRRALTVGDPLWTVSSRAHGRRPRRSPPPESRAIASGPRGAPFGRLVVRVLRGERGVRAQSAHWGMATASQCRRSSGQAGGHRNPHAWVSSDGAGRTPSVRVARCCQSNSACSAGPGRAGRASRVLFALDACPPGPPRSPATAIMAIAAWRLNASAGEPACCGVFRCPLMPF
jgi:hypothetical protein